MMNSNKIVFYWIFLFASLLIVCTSCEILKDDPEPPSENDDNGYIEFGTITDGRNGKTYKTVRKGDQVWMAENLAYLPDITYEDDWGSEDEAQYAVYDYAPGSGTETVAGAISTQNYQVYGVLYNWAAAMHGQESSDANPSGLQGICPPGWHLPSDEEWTVLTDYLGLHAGGKLKETGTIEAGTGLWHDPNSGATNESGFTAIPGGYKQPKDVVFYDDPQMYIGKLEQYKGISTGETFT